MSESRYMYVTGTLGIQWMLTIIVLTALKILGMVLPYSRKVWQVKSLVNSLFSNTWLIKVCRMYRSARKLQLQVLILKVLVWQTIRDSTNFPPAKLSFYTVQ